MATAGQQQTRNATRPLNVRANHGRLDLRSNFFLVRVTEDWNEKPDKIKNLRTVGGFKEPYKNYREKIVPV